MSTDNLWQSMGGKSQLAAQNRRRAKIARAARGHSAPTGTARAAAEPAALTLAQTIVLLALSRGVPMPVSHVGYGSRQIPPITRSKLLAARYITPRPHAITATGEAALTESPWLAKAERAFGEAVR